MDVLIHIEMLGGFRLHSEAGQVVELPCNQSGAILAFLALRAGKAITREQLTAALWQDADLDEGRRRLRQALYTLRKDLDAWAPGGASLLVAQSSTVGLEAARLRTDVCEFEQCIRAAESTPAGVNQAEYLQRAIGFYGGDLLPGFYQECFAADQRRVSETHLQALHSLPLVLEETGDHYAAIKAARSAINADPLHEETHCCLMRLYAATGQPSLVLRQYADLEQALAREGESPSTATRSLMSTLRETGREVMAARAPAPGLAPTAIRARPRTDRHMHRSRARSGRSRLFLGAAATVLVAMLFAARSFKPHRIAARPIGTQGNVNPVAIPDTVPMRGPEWSREIPFQPGDTGSEATAVAVGSLDKIYATGFVDNNKNHTDVDYLTEEITKDGTLQWQKRYNGPGNDVDRAKSVVVLGNGHILVTGESDGGHGNNESRLSGLDIATIEYDPASHEQIGESRWNSAADGEDRPIKIVRDARDSITVGGHGWERTTGRAHGQFNMVCLKINRGAGHSLPVSVAYPGLLGAQGSQTTDMTLQESGDISLAGFALNGTPSGPDEATVVARLAPGGETRWCKTVGPAGTTAHRDRVVCACVEGNVAVSAPALASWPASSHCEIVTTMLGPGGSALWSRTFRAASWTDCWPQVITASPYGIVLVAGQFQQQGGAEHLCLVAYDEATGTELWSRTLVGVSDGQDCPIGVRVSPDGTIYVAGYSSVRVRRGVTKHCLLALKLSPKGKPLWLSRFTATPDGWAEGRAMCLARDGSLIVAGQSDCQGKRKALVVKYAP